MFKRLGLSALVLGTAMALFPGTAQARDRDDRDREHHRHRFSVYFGVGPTYYPGGFYDRWGYWHPYVTGYYDGWGYWHPYRY